MAHTEARNDVVVEHWLVAAAGYPLAALPREKSSNADLGTVDVVERNVNAAIVVRHVPVTIFDKRLAGSSGVARFSAVPATNRPTWALLGVYALVVGSDIDRVCPSRLDIAIGKLPEALSQNLTGPNVVAEAMAVAALHILSPCYSDNVTRLVKMSSQRNVKRRKPG